VKKIHFNLQATLEESQFEKTFQRLFVQGSIVDHDLGRRMARLENLFQVYRSTCPVPCWSRGLAVTNEIRRVTETYLDYSLIRQALVRIVKKSLAGHFDPPQVLFTVDGWLEFLEMKALWDQHVNPAALVANLAENQADRVRFLFGLYLPQQFGGSYGRYPSQLDFLERWLTSRSEQWHLPITCLDAACGSGEGSYELAGLLLKCGFDVSQFRVTGATINPLEVFAAAYGYLPHDIPREHANRQYMRSFGALPMINFVTADLKSWEPTEKYHIILCNGILGGPFLHAHEEVESVIKRLVRGMHSGGILLAADRFHGGWKKMLSQQELEGLLTRSGLTVIPASEGVAGILK
jgi:chemotaxis methyl-accepting protein methylase